MTIRILAAATAALATVCAASCTELDLADEADKFVGEYNLSITETVNVASIETLTYSYIGTLTVTKTGPTSVHFQAKYGDGLCFNTLGEAAGSNVVLNGITSNESTGKCTSTFSPVTLTGNILTFTMYMSGDLYSGGTTYPFHATSAITATRKR